MSYVFWQISSLIKLRLGKLRQEKKGTVLVFFASVLECHHISYFEKWKLWAMFFGRFLCWWNYDQQKLRQEKKVLCKFFWFCGEIVFGITSVQYSSQFFCCGFRHIWAASKTICRKKMWSQFLPNLSLYSCAVVSVFCCGSRQIWFAPKTIHWKIMWSQFPRKLSCLQNNPPKNNVEPVPAKSSTLLSGKLFWRQLRFSGNWLCN